ncbi:hypothetical protein Tco_0935394 [Tanacetum coccineum]
MRIPAWMITDEMKLMEHYKMYAEVFELDVPLKSVHSRLSIPRERIGIGTHNWFMHWLSDEVCRNFSENNTALPDFLPFALDKVRKNKMMNLISGMIMYSLRADDDEIPTKQVSQDIMEEISLTIDEAKLKKMTDEMLRQRCTSRDEKQLFTLIDWKNFLQSDIVWESRKEILVSSHPRKITPLVQSSIVFNDDDIEERTSRWVNKCIKKFNPYARYGVENWKNPHAKIFYIRRQKEPGRPKEEIYSNSKIVSSLKNTGNWIAMVSISVHQEFSDMGKRIEEYDVFSIVYEPVHGIIYTNSKKEKRVMRHSEIHKFCDATLRRTLEGLKSYYNDVKYGYVDKLVSSCVGNMRMTSQSLMNPVSLAENHQSCRKNKDGQKVLLNGQTWRPRLLLLCYSMKILNEANSLQKPQEPFDSRKFFGFHVLSPPQIANSCAIDLLNRNGVRTKYVDLAHFADSQGENQPIMPQILMGFRPMYSGRGSRSRAQCFLDPYATAIVRNRGTFVSYLSE